MMLKLCEFFKTCSGKILAKLVNQGVAAALFSSRCLKNFETEKFPLLESNAFIDMGVRG